jgi:hypothetical protein
MELCLFMLLISFLILLAYQDFRYRKVSVYLLISAICCTIINAFYLNGLRQTFLYAGLNVVMSLIQLFGVYVFFAIKTKAKVNFFQYYLGLGDVLFYLILIFCFSPLNFIQFNIVVCFVILIIYGLLEKFKSYKNTIPFAGCLSLALVLTLTLSHLFEFNTYIDVNNVFSYILI